MKTLSNFALSALLTVCSLASTAQKIPINEPDYNKPKLFNDLPEKFPLDLKLIDALLLEQHGKSVQVILDDLSFHGVVVSKSNIKDKEFQSTVIRLTNRSGAVLNLVKLFEPDGTVSYRGRIISHKHGDAFEVTYEKGQYVFVKKSYHDLFNE
jgi:hypothetical protein